MFLRILLAAAARVKRALSVNGNIEPDYGSLNI
jgi:hypothetical protein